MTPFPQSPFPRCTQRDAEFAAGLDCTDYDCRAHRNPVIFTWRSELDFPVLRSSPLWQQTWVEESDGGLRLVMLDGQWRIGGRWFPPLGCTLNLPGDARCKIFTPDFRLQRIYSSPSCRCSDCLDNAQTIELMLAGIAWECAKDDWPEHRCWWAFDLCTCGKWHSVTNPSDNNHAMHMSTLHWRKRNQFLNGDLLDIAHVRTSAATDQDIVDSALLKTFKMVFA